MISFVAIALLLITHAILQYRKKHYGGAVVAVFAAILLTVAILLIYSGRDAVSERLAVVAETPTVGDDGSVSVNILSLLGGGRWSGIHCADSISYQQCGGLRVGTLVTIRTTFDSYGVSSHTVIAEIQDSTS